MTRDVITIHYSASIKELSKLLSERGITGVPVIDEENRLLGMISMRDVIKEEVRRLGTNVEYQDIYELFSSAMNVEEGEQDAGPQLWVEELMSRNIYSAAEDTPVCQICTLMFEHNIHRIPVLREGKVVGLVTAMDVVRTVAEGLEAKKRP
jgi:CBS domain-containing protein